MRAMTFPAVPAKSSSRFRTTGIFLGQLACCTALALALQAASGAYHAELAAYPDEPSHAVTGIMLERYISHPEVWRSPVPYVENYYLHYPKVAIGHWPPLLYVFQAAAAFLFGPTRITLLVLQAFLAGLLGTIVFRLLFQQAGLFAAIAGTCSLLLVKVIQIHTSMVMADMLLTLTMLLATLAFVRFTSTESWKDSMLFGLWTSAAVLTKGTGWALGIVPFAVLLLTRRWRLLKSPAFWASGVVIAVFCIPWQLATTHMASVGWDSDSPNWQYAVRAGMQLTAMMFTVPGALLTTLALAGVWFTIVMRWKAGVKPLAAGLAALVFADWLLHVAVPAGAEMRKVIIAVPPLFVLAAMGSVAIARLMVPGHKVLAAATALFSAVCFLGLWSAFPVMQKPQYGYIPTAHSLAEMMPKNTAVLVSSDANGEGALISELALLNPDPERYVVRGSKLLSLSEWNGRNRREMVSGEEDCSRILSSVPIGFVVMDLRPEVNDQDHALLQSYLDHHAGDWKLVRRFAPENGQNPGVAVYRSTAKILPVRHLVINVHQMIGRDVALP